MTEELFNIEYEVIGSHFHAMLIRKVARDEMVQVLALCFSHVQALAREGGWIIRSENIHIQPVEYVEGA